MNATEDQAVRGLVAFDEMRQMFDGTSERFVALLRRLPEDAGARQVPGLDWTVAETAAHLIGILGRGLGDLRRGDTLAELHELNARCLEEVEMRDLQTIADRLEADAHRASSLLAMVKGDEPFPLHCGVVAEISAALSYSIFDLLVHGFDIANATGHAWRIPAGDAARVLRAALPAMRPWIDPAILDGAPQRLVVALSPEEPAIALEAGAGRYHVELTAAAEADGPTDPEQVLLTISGRRKPEDETTRRLSSWFLPI